MRMIGSLVFLCLSLASGLSPKTRAQTLNAAPVPDDTRPIREVLFTNDTPHPSAWAAWPGKAAQCIYGVGGPDYRRDADPAWGLSNVLDLVQGIGVSDTIYIPRVRNAPWRMPADQHPLEVQWPADLDYVLEDARARHLRVWVFLNWNTGGLDFTSARYRQTMHNMLDSLAAKKAQHPHLIGTWLDEIWCGMSANAYTNKLDAFQSFCRAEFSEEFPGDAMPLKVEPANKWWRRYVMFKYCIYESFIKDYTEYSTRVGLQTMPFLVNPHRYKRGSGWGHDRYRQSKYGDFISSPTYYKNPFPVENSVMHLQGGLNGFAFTQVFRGLPVQHYISEYYRNNPETVAGNREAFALAQEWREAQPMEEVAFLTYPVAHMGLFANSETVFAQHDERIQQSLNNRFAVRMLDVRETRLFKNYRVLVTGRYSAYSVPSYALEGLRAFVENGGTLVALDTEFAEGRRDLTDPAPRTETIAGVTPGEQRALSGPIRLAGLADLELPLEEGTLAPAVAPGPGAAPIAFAGELPIGFERPLGKGKVICLYADVARQLGAAPGIWIDALTGLIRQAHSPAVQSTGDLSVQGVIRKGERVMISLFTGSGPRIDVSSSPFQVPFASPDILRVQGAVHVNVPALGLRSERYQVFSLATYTLIPPPTGADTWTPAELLSGIPAAVNRDPGFENLVIEPPGTPHPGTFLADVRAAEQAREALLDAAASHPPIGHDPLRTRIRIARSSATLSAPWPPDAVRSLLPLRIDNPADSGTREPVTLPAEPILQALGTPAPAVDRLALAQRRNAAWQAIPLQVNAWKDTDRSASRAEAGNLAPTDDLVFIADLAAGTNEFFLLVRPESAPAATPQTGVSVVSSNQDFTIDTGLNRVVLLNNGEMSVFPEGAQDPYLRMESFGSRFLTVWQAPVTWETIVNGPVETIFRRRAVGQALGKAAGVTLQAEFRMYANSPTLYFSLTSDLTGSFYHIHWPKGWLYKGTSAPAGGGATYMLTERGWEAPGFASLKFRDGYKSGVRYGKEGEQRGLGLLVTSSTFPRAHTWLCEGHGLFWWQPAAHHCATELLRNAGAEYLLIEGLTETEAIDREAERLKMPLVVELGPLETRSNP